MCHLNSYNNESSFPMRNIDSCNVPRRMASFSSKKREQPSVTELDNKYTINKMATTKKRPSTSATCPVSSNKLFSMNMSNFLRKSNNEKDIETSIIEKELIYIEVHPFIYPYFTHTHCPTLLIKTQSLKRPLWRVRTRRKKRQSF